jgi:hypothetical protein
MIALQIMTQHDLIKAIGGAKHLAEKLRGRGVLVANVTVRSWTLTGRSIPAKYWSHVVAIAGETGVRVSFETLASQVAATSSVGTALPSERAAA